MIMGIRRGDFFIPKKYSKTEGHVIELITEIEENGSVIMVGERAE